jgi:glycosyltransferase involved in cell wall biosynthesis
MGFCFGGNLKIVMLSRHGCFRVMKEALPLIARGHEVHLIVNQLTQGSEHFTTVCVYQELDQLYSAIRFYAKDADIFHAHNEPAWFVSVCKDIGVKQPVVLDIHDSHLLRKTPEQTDEEQKTNPAAFRIAVDERNNFQLADAIVYCCEPMREIVGKEFGLSQPNIVLPSYLPRGFFRIDFQEWIGGIVYEGRIDVNDELPDKWVSVFAYSNYLPFARRAAQLGVNFHVYTPRSNEKVRKQYDEVCFLHPPLNLDRLIKAMGSHDWGLTGNLDFHEEWKHALPNKLFEYLASGLPVVAMNADHSAKWIKEYDIGIVVSSIEELMERWAEHRDKRANVFKRRREFEMESHIGELETLYRSLH